MSLPKPFYVDPFITLYHGDALELADIWLSGDVMVTDPPYGVAYQSNMVKGREKNPIAGDGDTKVRDAVLTAWQTMPDRPALVFGRWDVERPAGVRQRLIWSKGESPGMGNLKMPWGPGDEEIYVIGAGWKGKRTSNVITVNTPPPNNRGRAPHPRSLSSLWNG